MMGGIAAVTSYRSRGSSSAFAVEPWSGEQAAAEVAFAAGQVVDREPST